MQSSRDSFDIEDHDFGPQALPVNWRSKIRWYKDHMIKPNLGVSLLIFAQFFNSLMVVSTKLLETDPDLEEPIQPLQILFIRMFITFIGTIIYMVVMKVPDAPFGPRELRKFLILRGTTGFFGVFGLYYSLMYLTVSDAVTITFLIPSFTGFLAWVILRERYTIVEFGGAITSLCGVILIARPTFLFGVPDSGSGSSAETSNPQDRVAATFVGLLGVVGASFVYIIIRHIGKRAHAVMSVTYFALITCIISFFGILVIPKQHFQMPINGRQWFLFTLIGVCGFIFQLLLTYGIQLEKAGRSSLMAYTQVVYALFWELLIWHHLPVIWSWLGMIIVIGSAFVVIKYKPSETMPKRNAALFDIEEAIPMRPIGK